MPAPRSGQEQSLVERLNASVNRREANNLLSIDKYFRSATLLQRQARTYRLDHNDAQLYVMLLRFVSLVVETIPKHQGFQREDNAYQLLRKECLPAMAELERLRIELDLKDKASKAQQLEQAPFLAVKAPGAVPLSAGSLPELQWDSLQPPQTAPSNSFPGELDFFGLPLQRSSPGQQQQQLAPALPTLPTLSTNIKLRPASHATLSKHAILPTLSSTSTSAFSQPQLLRRESDKRPLYPEFAAPLPPSQPAPNSIEAQLASLDVSSPQPQQDGEQNGQHWQPSPYGELQLGPQEVAVQSRPQPTAPPAPGETCCTPPPEAPGNLAVMEVPKGGVAEVKRRQSIRDVHVSVALMDEFMRYAISNTKRGIETCGILAGVLSANDATFTITTLIVPKQEGTTDTVQALNEEDIFEAQDSRGLYPLGWIHTHPTQTCFLSSVDIHTHCGYQTMLDEAVAIVMAPKDPSKRVGIFRLSTPGGLKLVQRCPQRGFHSHPPTETGQPIYELCGHVYLNPRVSYEVLDLR